MRLILVIAIFTLGIDSLAEAGARRSRPVQTGLTECWNASGTPISCSGTGQDGELRRGEPRAYIVNGNGTIKDNRTALTWEVLSDDGSIHDVDNTYTWTQAFSKIAALNSPPCFTGFCDWRVPNRFELETLLNLTEIEPAISSVFDTGCIAGCTVTTCSCTAPFDYWTSSSYKGNPEFAWAVGFLVGGISAPAKTEAKLVRAVRGGS